MAKGYDLEVQVTVPEHVLKALAQLLVIRSGRKVTYKEVDEFAAQVLQGWAERMIELGVGRG